MGDRSVLELVILAVALAAAALAAPRVLEWSGRRREAKLVSQREAAEAPAGRPVGSPAPDFTLHTVDGEVRTLDALCARGLPVALVFVHPECGPCDVLLPSLRDWRARLDARLTIAVVSEGSREANRAIQQHHGIEELLVQERSEVYKAYEFRQGTPAAVVVDPDRRIASVAVSGTLAVEELVRLTLRRGEPSGHPGVAA